MTQSSQKESHQEIESYLSKALKKLGVKDENSICHYLPGAKGGYIHHFTLRKMRQQEPQALVQLLKKHILDQAQPTPLTPKTRAPRGSRKRKDVLQLNPTAIERLLHLARVAGDREAIAMLTPKRSISSCKRELITSIRAGRVDHELWNAYLACSAQEEMQANALAFTK
jgi:hypothetical protein